MLKQEGGGCDRETEAEKRLKRRPQAGGKEIKKAGNEEQKGGSAPLAISSCCALVGHKSQLFTPFQSAVSVNTNTRQCFVHCLYILL
jgi:hypothetical protein